MAIQGAGSVGHVRVPQNVTQQRQDRQEQLRGANHNVTGDASKTVGDAGAEAAEISINVMDTSTAEDMAAFIAQIRNRRELERQASFFADGDLDHVLDDESPEKIERLLAVLRSEAKNKPDVFLKYARSLFPDESCLVAALRVLLKTLQRRKILSDEADVVGAALAEAENDANIKPTVAGINIALKARLFGKKLKMSPASVRSAYRDFIESDDHELDIYEKWVVFYGPERRHILIDFMEKALLTDMEATDASCSDDEFGFLLKRIAQIKLIRSGDAVFIEGVNRSQLSHKYGCTEEQWLLFLISSLQNPDGIYANITEVGGVELKEASVQEKAEFLQSLQRQCEKIPEEIYADPIFRMELLEKLQGLITTAHQLEWEASLNEPNQDTMERICV